MRPRSSVTALRSPPARLGCRAGDYVELRARSAFSFLEGASNPEDLACAAASAGHDTLALADRGGVYGIPRFHHAARAQGIRAIVGARVDITATELPPPAGNADSTPKQPFFSLQLLVASPLGWRQLCRLLTVGHAGRPKRECVVTWEQLEEHSQGLLAFARADATLAQAALDRSAAIFGPRRLWVDVSRTLERETERAARRGTALAQAQQIPVVATGDVRCATQRERSLLDVFQCLLHKRTLDGAGRLLLPNGEHFLQPAKSVIARFADRPEWVRETRAVAERCAFQLQDLDYRFPEFPLTPGETQASALRALTLLGARERYGHPLPSRARAQIERELAVIAKLDLDGYFLIVNDIARYARKRRMLAQGRGSAANSAVCYALGITAVDPVGMDLLFERFLSEERGEWPDIDIDLPSGPQREDVIQYVFAKYGELGAAMTANVITYRSRMAVREMGKVLGLAPDAIDRLARVLSGVSFRDDLDELPETLRAAGVDMRAPRTGMLLDLVSRVQGLPRHLGQHSGGIVIAANRLDEVVPIEPASMPNRRVVQWDKDDCADLGIIKVDLLGLGMLSALEKTLPLIRKHEGVAIDLAHLPPDDPDTYAMIRRADTVGTFQIESRAQMATLPRLKPRCFYDLVVEIAIIRPGPIVGQMVHPYLNRRAGREAVTYPHPSLEPILKRTLGIPLFQEQLLRIAMTVAGFTGGEAEELRRAMGFKRSTERMLQIEERLRSGMTERGIGQAAQEEIVRHITSFALYGFPESHSASFALIAYASAYLKCHHPAAFLAGLLNAYPLGFYNPATLVKDAQRHGVEVRAIDVAHSHWRCTLEAGTAQGATRPAPTPPALRLGLRYAHGLHQQTADALVQARSARPFEDLGDLLRRVEVRSNELDTLAELGALSSLAARATEGSQKTVPGRRSVLWQVAALERDPSSLFAGRAPGTPTEDESEAESPLTPMTPFEETLADYRLSGVTVGPQLMAHLRPELQRRGVISARELRNTSNGRFVRMAGHVIVRQRPGAANGFCFITLEDETGTANGVLTPRQFKRFRAPLHASSVVEIAGPLQNVDNVVHIRIRELRPLHARRVAPTSHDYR